MSEENELLQALENERAFIAEELHQTLCQNLCSLSIHLRTVGKNVAALSPALLADFDELRLSLDACIDQSRILGRTLIPPVANAGALIDALTELAAEKGASFEGPETGEFHLAPAHCLAFFRIAQAALRSGATNLRLTQHEFEFWPCKEIPLLRAYAEAIGAQLRSSGDRVLVVTHGMSASTSLASNINDSCQPK